MNFASQVNIWGSTDAIRNWKFCMSSRSKNIGYRILILLNRHWRSCTMASQIRMKCFSSSIIIQYGHKRCLTSVLLYRPRSISKGFLLTFCINPFCTGVLNAVSAIFFKSSLNIIVNFLLKFVGFELNFLNFKHDTFSLSHLNLMAIGLTVTKPSANKCRSLCKLMSNSMHANLEQTNDGIAMKLRYRRQEWVSQS